MELQRISFFKDTWDFIDCINSDSAKLAYLCALGDYAFRGVEPKFDGFEEKNVMTAGFAMARHTIDASRMHSRNGAKGAAKKRYKNAQTNNKGATLAGYNSPLSENDVSPLLCDIDVDSDIDKELKKEKEESQNTYPASEVSDAGRAREKPVSTKEPKHKHGEYKHVLLSETEYSKLLDEFGADKVAHYIRVVDEYCERNGKKYKNYNLAVRTAIRDSWGGKWQEPDKPAAFDPATHKIHEETGEIVPINFGRWTGVQYELPGGVYVYPD